LKLVDGSCVRQAKRNKCPAAAGRITASIATVLSKRNRDVLWTVRVPHGPTIEWKIHHYIKGKVTVIWVLPLLKNDFFYHTGCSVVQSP